MNFLELCIINKKRMNIEIKSWIMIIIINYFELSKAKRFNLKNILNIIWR